MVKNKEYCCSVNNINRPVELTGNEAIGTRLMNLIMMEPGDDPLHPDMGVGLNTYRYGVNNLSDLQNRVQSQIETYLPFYQNVNVSIIQTPDKVCNIEILIGNTVYIYDSSNTSKPITLSDIT
jgi:hypothetical protein